MARPRPQRRPRPYLLTGDGKDRPWVVLDIDGVIADVRHRLHHLDSRPRNWDAFFAAARHDPALAEGVVLAREAALEARVAYVTGRPERCRADTVAWLREQGLPAGELLMRGENDRRPADRAKPAMVRQLARQAPVAMVVDDDPAVCAALRRAGHQVQLAAWMPAGTGPGSVLHVAQEDQGRT